ncbi:MAG: hypothetical protein ACYTBR_08930 [Planctomycetota bacterium]
MPSTDCRTRCVLLAPKGDRAQDRGEDIQSLLDRRGWIAHEAYDALGALAELCLLERTQSLRQAWGLQTIERLALVVVEPQQWSQLPAMLSAARRYVPKASLWSFANSGLHPLGPTVPEGETRRSGTNAPPATRDRTTEVTPPTVSGDEIAMLLEDEDREPQA